ncbi:hypothetical protein C5167_048545 [Papaver somniferum]|uniref:Uncharacterized protein n=1 Tax=Papaver somniferum TaxID=3469 RepID=A0A4Y7KMG6_PAPSO|nr:hypothetical protein C5167_048545 [Papaver somniferum]
MELGFFKSLSQWVGNNLMKSGDHETWAFDLQGAVDMFNLYRKINTCGGVDGGGAGFGGG